MRDSMKEAEKILEKLILKIEGLAKAVWSLEPEALFLLFKRIVLNGLAVGAFIFFVFAVAQVIFSPIKGTLPGIKKEARRLWKEMACAPNSALNHIVKPDADFCRNKCGEKDPAAEWCNASGNAGVPVDGMISYVAEGGCAVAAAGCYEEKCRDESLACVAECPPHPRRVITKDGCECEGNWTPYGKECVCRDPYIIKDGECISIHDRECDNNIQETQSVFECHAPLQEVRVFWRGTPILECQGYCYSLFCVSNDSVPVGDFRYFRGKFYDIIPAEKGGFKSYVPSMGGYYGVCRAPL
ncbi:MAG: hypothetical protein AB1650_06370 [Candidatus Omnitrophota bacterium]